jgi:hypothetical protein
MSRLFTIISCLGIATLIGCGPRAEVAKDKVVAQIDKVLGELDVKMKTAEQGLEKNKKLLEDVKQKRHLAASRIDVIDKRQIEPLQEDIDRGKKILEDFQPHINKSEDVTIKGKVYSPEKVKASVTSILDLVKKKQAEIAPLQEQRVIHEKTHEFLQKQEKVLEKQVTDLETSMKQIKAKKEQAETMKQASAATSGVSTEDFESLNKQVNELFAEVDASVAYHEEELDKELKKVTDNVDLSDYETDADLSAEINKILGAGVPADEKKAEPKPDDTKADDTKADDTKADEAKADEAKAESAKTAE